MRQYTVRSTKEYKKDFKRLMKSGYGKRELEAVIDLLATGDDLPTRYRDHPLHGALEGTHRSVLGIEL